LPNSIYVRDPAFELADDPSDHIPGLHERVRVVSPEFGRSQGQSLGFGDLLVAVGHPPVHLTW